MGTKFNKVEGVDNEFSFAGKVISIGSALKANSNGNEYVVGTVEYILPSGEKTQRSAMIYKKSLDKGMVPERTYLCTLTLDGENAWIRASHLTVAEKATASDFAFLQAQPVVAEAGDEIA